MKLVCNVFKFNCYDNVKYHKLQKTIQIDFSKRKNQIVYPAVNDEKKPNLRVNEDPLAFVVPWQISDDPDKYS